MGVVQLWFCPREGTGSVSIFASRTTSFQAGSIHYYAHAEGALSQLWLSEDCPSENRRCCATKIPKMASDKTHRRAVNTHRTLPALSQTSTWHRRSLHCIQIPWPPTLYTLQGSQQGRLDQQPGHHIRVQVRGGPAILIVAALVDRHRSADTNRGPPVGHPPAAVQTKLRSVGLFLLQVEAVLVITSSPPRLFQF